MALPYVTASQVEMIVKQILKEGGSQPQPSSGMKYRHHLSNESSEMNHVYLFNDSAEPLTSVNKVIQALKLPNYTCYGEEYYVIPNCMTCETDAETGDTVLYIFWGFPVINPAAWWCFMIESEEDIFTDEVTEL